MKDTFKIMGVVLLILVFGFVVSTVMRSCNQAVTATHVDDATAVYEEYQEIYNTCQQLNENLAVVQATPSDDAQFTQFSKQAQLNSIKMKLNRWVEDYNAKSLMWGRSNWKSAKLPYQLDVNQFSNYNK